MHETTPVLAMAFPSRSLLVVREEGGREKVQKGVRGMILRDQLKIDEGVRHTVYLCPAGHPSVGVGWNLDAHPLPPEIAARLTSTGRISDADIDYLLDLSIERALNDCRTLYADFDSFTRARQDALVNFVFNVGMGTAATFVVTNSLIDNGEWEEASKQILRSKWAKQVGARADRIAKAIREG